MDLGLFMERYGYRLLMVLFASIVIGVISIPFLIMFWGFSGYAPVAGVITVVAFVLGAIFVVAPREWRSETITRTWFRTPNEVYYDKNEKKRR
ncbi:hypothetical protein [Thermococcus sp. 5-4]|uniref:hypothetical protein n=1 Tax=Thermococcus sp. 5-4 TaxID=2008440 RepID=UPI000B49C7D3|nr:hypothetical protein [Thermococcus sp. 5-4]ASA76884.1 hypothetical protein CDI07_00755 [Thermococcus sp. 5-4]